MRLLVIGPEDFEDYDFVARKLDCFTANLKQFTVLVHKGKGVSRLVEHWAHDRRRPREVYYPTEDPLPTATALVLFRRRPDKAADSLTVKAVFAKLPMRIVELEGV